MADSAAAQSNDLSRCHCRRHRGCSTICSTVLMLHGVRASDSCSLWLAMAITFGVLALVNRERERERESGVNSSCVSIKCACLISQNWNRSLSFVVQSGILVAICSSLCSTRRAKLAIRCKALSQSSLAHRRCRPFATPAVWRRVVLLVLPCLLVYPIQKMATLCDDVVAHGSCRENTSTSIQEPTSWMLRIETHRASSIASITRIEGLSRRHSNYA